MSPSPAVGLAFPCRRTTHRFRVQATAMPQQSAQEPSGGSTGGAAVASGPAAGTAAASSSSSTGGSGTTFDLVCPICLTTPLRLQQVAGRPCGDLRCQRCARTFTSTATFADLTLTAGIQQKAYQQSSWGGTTIFQSPLVSFVYERGWRQGFAWAGMRHCGVGGGGWRAGRQAGSTLGPTVEQACRATKSQLLPCLLCLLRLVQAFLGWTRSMSSPWTTCSLPRERCWWT